MSYKEQFKKLRRQKYFLAMLIFTLVAVILWIMASLTSSQRKLGISAELKVLAKPLNPQLNRDVIARLEAKKKYTLSELAEFPIFILVKLDDGSGFQVIELGKQPENEVANLSQDASVSAQLLDDSEKAASPSATPPAKNAKKEPIQESSPSAIQI